MGKHEIYLAGGCFWGTQAYLQKLPGILMTEVGYANSNADSPSYEQVCSGATDAVETVRVLFDDDRMPLALLLRGFFRTIDPTTKNRQGNDRGTQYRSGHRPGGLGRAADPVREAPRGRGDAPP